MLNSEHFGRAQYTRPFRDSDTLDDVCNESGKELGY